MKIIDDMMKSKLITLVIMDSRYILHILLFNNSSYTWYNVLYKLGPNLEDFHQSYNYYIVFMYQNSAGAWAAYANQRLVQTTCRNIVL